MLELFVACGFAITQPVLALYGANPDVWVYRSAGRREVVLFAIVVTLVPTVALWGIELIVGLVSARARRLVHCTALVVLTVLFAVQLMKHFFDTTAVVVVTAALFVLLCAALYAKTEAARSWMMFASPAPLVFALVFVFASSVTPLAFPDEVHAAQLGSSARAPSVVMIVFDEWPTSSFVDTDGNIDRTLFPNLAAFADTSTWYRNATTVTNATMHAVPAIVTGKYPKQGAQPLASSWPQSLFTFLGGTYRLAASEIVTRLCPQQLCVDSQPVTVAGGLRGILDNAASSFGTMVNPSKERHDITTGFQEAGIDSAVDVARNATGKRDAANGDLGVATANRPARFAQFLEGIRPGEQPTVHFMHILLPHVVHRYLPNGDEYPFPGVGDSFAKQGERWSREQWPVTLGQQRMILQAQYTDLLIGELMERLRATNNFDRSVVVLTADHGLVHEPGAAGRGLDAPAVPTSSYPELLWSPLFVKATDQTTGTISDANVMSIDVLPTIAKLTGFTIPWKVDGVPAGTRPGATKIFMKSTANAFGADVARAVPVDGRAGEAAMFAHGVSAFAPKRGASAEDAALRLYRVGPYGPLIGTPLATATVGSPAPGEVRLEQRAALTNLQRVRGNVPALVWGTATSSATIALAVNGRVAAIAPTFRDGDEPNRVAVMLPEALLRTGNNRVQAFRVEGSGARPVVHPIALAG